MDMFGRWTLTGYSVIAILGWSIACTTLARATWKPDGTQTQEQMQWFQRAETTNEAYKRLGWRSCCDHADRYKTTFLQDAKTEDWYFYDKAGKLKHIPADVIHHEYDEKMPAQLRAEGVLFIVGEVIACFWPPETGG